MNNENHQDRRRPEAEATWWRAIRHRSNFQIKKQWVPIVTVVFDWRLPTAQHFAGIAIISLRLASSFASSFSPPCLSPSQKQPP